MTHLTGASDIIDDVLVLMKDVTEVLATGILPQRVPNAPASSAATQEETLWLQLLTKMTAHVVAHLPNIWQTVQVSNTGSPED